MFVRAQGILAALIASVSTLVLPCLAQTSPPANPATAQPTPESVLLEVQRFYRSQATCERMQIEVRTPGPGSVGSVGMRTARSSIMVRVQPAAADMQRASGSNLAALSLELGELNLVAGDGRLVAVHDRDAASYFEAPFSAELTSRRLASVVPPILLPQADLANASGDTAISGFWPYAEGITWQSVEADGRHPARRIVKGQSPGGPVELAVQGSRLRTLKVHKLKSGVVMTLSCSPVAPCDASKFVIETARRSRVDSLASLQPRGGTLRVGNRVPALPLTLAGGQSWAIDDLLQPPFEAVLEGGGARIAPAEHAVLVFLRVLPPGATSELTRFKPEQLAALLRDLRTEAFRPKKPEAAPGSIEQEPVLPLARFGYAPVLVMTTPAPDEVLSRIQAATRQWGGGGVGAEVDARNPVNVLWTTEPRATIDLFAPGAEAVAVVLDAELVLRAVISVGKGDTSDQVADKIAAALFELTP